MGVTLRRFGLEFLEAFQAMNETSERLRHVRVLPPSLSTITFTGTLSRGQLPVEDMRLAACLAEELGEPLEFTVDCDLAKRKRSRGGGAAAPRGNKRFRYQLPLKRHGKSVKVFHNGSVHATGCTSSLEFLDMMDALLAFVRDTAALEVRLVDFNIHLINTLFLVTCPRSGRPLTIAPQALLARLGGTRADFDTERHPSVKIPVHDGDAKVATACVFQTGSVSVLGARRPSAVALAFRTVCEALDAAAPAVCAPDPAQTVRTTTAKQPLVLRAGYPFNLHSCCLF